MRFSALWLTILIALPGLAAAEEKPNIVFIFMDNFGYGELGVYGGGIAPHYVLTRWRRRECD
jgi:hypothetical protein